MSPLARKTTEGLPVFYLQDILQQLKSGNWAGFGKELDALRPLLEELNQHSAGR